jgi:hypothetical protein
MDPREDPGLRIAKQILSRKAMARGVVVLDENLVGLESALREANIQVVKSSAGLSDYQNKEQFLSHRILITKKALDFIDDAPVYEYGVVALDKLAFIDPAQEYSKNKTVQLISKALSKYGLWAKGAKFLLELHGDGKHQLTDLS